MVTSMSNVEGHVKVSQGRFTRTHQKQRRACAKALEQKEDTSFKNMQVSTLKMDVLRNYSRKGGSNYILKELLFQTCMYVKNLNFIHRKRKVNEHKEYNLTGSVGRNLSLEIICCCTVRVQNGPEKPVDTISLNQVSEGVVVKKRRGIKKN